MNAKKARQLRKEAMYHPSQERSYIRVNKSRANPNKGTVELEESCSRSLYKSLKKDYYEGN